MNELLIIFLVGILPCLIVGVWQTCVGCQVMSRAIKSETWKVTQGRLMTHNEEITNEVNFHLNTPLQVTYQVEGQRYFCKKISLYENWKQRNEVANQLQQLVEVPVYYNPRNHHEAVIEKGIKPAYWAPVVLGVSSLLMAIAGFYFLVF